MAQVSVDVHRVGAMAFVRFYNPTSRVVELVIDGLQGDAQLLRISGNDRYRSAYTVAGDLVVRVAGEDGAILFPVPDDAPGDPVTNQPSGRYSRFPAVNREVVPEAAPAADVFPPEPVAVPSEPDALAEAILSGDVPVEALVDVTPEPDPEAQVVVTEPGEVVVAEADGEAEVEGSPEVTAEVALDLSELDGLNVTKTVAWAGDDPVKRAAVLARELASESPRKGVISALA